jgi:hypothetical protein
MHADIYFLFTEFDEALIRSFISAYLNGFSETTSYYEYPPYSGKNSFETDDFEKFLAFLLSEKKAYFHFYFSPSSVEYTTEIEGGMIFFNRDGTLYLGLTVRESCINKYTEEINSKFGSKIALVCHETLPPNNALDFEKAYYKN